MSALLERLASNAPLLLDGGLGSMLIARGLAGGAPPEAWVLDRPDELRAVHRAYVEAGSEAIHTCTFGANPIRLATCGLGERFGAIQGAAVALARDAGPRFVLGDVGPTGEYRPPVGTGDPVEWREAFLAQGRLLAEAGVDALHVETMSDLTEALVALEALREAAPGVPVLVSLTFDRKRRGFFTAMGDPLAASLRRLADAGADAVGANCSVTSEDMRALAAEAVGAVAVPVVLQPNAGQPRLTAAVPCYDQSPAAFAADMAFAAGLGAGAVGGCCGTDPAFIAALRQRLAGTPT